MTANRKEDDPPADVSSGFHCAGGPGEGQELPPVCDAMFQIIKRELTMFRRTQADTRDFMRDELAKTHKRLDLMTDRLSNGGLADRLAAIETQARGTNKLLWWLMAVIGSVAGTVAAALLLVAGRQMLLQFVGVGP